MPPEFINNGVMTPKNVVFSLGVIIFYMIVGNKRYNDYYELRSDTEFTGKKREEFIDSVRKLFIFFPHKLLYLAIIFSYTLNMHIIYICQI